MNALRGLLVRLLKLLVDDWRLAAFSVACIGATWVFLHFRLLSPGAAGAALFIALVLIFMESVRRGTPR